MSDIILGNLITKEEYKDAIHIAVAPVIAGEKLQPGEHIGFIDNDRVGVTVENIGIVDPFLKRPVKEGETFWMLLYPRTTTNLRHEWEHPAFFDGKIENKIVKEEMSKSELYLRSLAANDGYDYQEFLKLLAETQKGSEDLCLGTASFESSDIWEHYENVTKTKVDKSIYIRCAC